MKIYDADNPDSPISKTLSGEKLQSESFDLLAAGLMIRFTSDGSNQRKGFLLRYESLGNGKKPFI